MEIAGSKASLLTQQIGTFPSSDELTTEETTGTAHSMKKFLSKNTTSDIKSTPQPSLGLRKGSRRYDSRNLKKLPRLASHRTAEKVTNSERQCLSLEAEKLPMIISPRPINPTGMFHDSRPSFNIAHIDESSETTTVNTHQAFSRESIAAFSASNV